MLRDIKRGTRLDNEIVVMRKLNCGKDWGIYKSFTNVYIICAHQSIMDKWCHSDLVPFDIFKNIRNTEGLYYSVSMQGKRLEYLPDAQSPNSIEDALTISLKNSRSKLGEDVNLGNSIFYEQYSCLLPTYEEEKRVSDDIVLGKWLTGGVQISAKKIKEISELMSWTSVQRIRKVVDTLGIEVEEPCESSVSNEIALRHEISDDDFILFGRKELTEFFNDHVIDIIKHPDEYAVMDIHFPGSIIMYGPPGSGKTYAAEALVEYLGWPSYYINSSTIGSKYIHETSKKISEIFNQAIENAPSVIMIDEMESFLSSRSEDGEHVYHNEEVGEFLRLLQKAKEKKVLILAMTNMINNIDEAIKRRGRFDHVIRVDMPSEAEIYTLLKKLLNKLPMEKNIELGNMAKAMHGKSMADVSFLVKEAGRRTVKKREKKIKQDTINEIIDEINRVNDKSNHIGFKIEE